MDDSYVFVIQYPVFTLVRPERFPKGKQATSMDLVQSLVKTGAPEYGDFLAVFTDDDLAKRFKEKLGGPPKAVLSLMEPALEGILADLDRIGVKHVGIDVDLSVTPPRGRFCPLREVLDAIRNQRKQ